MDNQEEMTTHRIGPVSPEAIARFIVDNNPERAELVTAIAGMLTESYRAGIEKSIETVQEIADEHTGDGYGRGELLIAVAALQELLAEE